MRKMLRTKKQLMTLLAATTCLALSLSGCATQTPSCKQVVIPKLPASVLEQSKNETIYYSEWQNLVLELQKLLTESKKH